MFADCVKALIIVIIIIVIIVVIIIIIFHAGLCLLCNKPYTRTRIKSEQVRTEPVITGLLPKYRGVETGPRVDVPRERERKKETSYKSVFVLVLFIYGERFFFIDIFAEFSFGKDWGFA